MIASHDNFKQEINLQLSVGVLALKTPVNIDTAESPAGRVNVTIENMKPRV